MASTPSMIANPYVQQPMYNHNSNPGVVMMTNPYAQLMYNPATGMIDFNTPAQRMVIVQQPLAIGQSSGPSVIHSASTVVTAIPIKVPRSRTWASGLFSCCEPSFGHCLVGTCCPCAPTAQIVAQSFLDLLTLRVMYYLRPSVSPPMETRMQAPGQTQVPGQKNERIEIYPAQLMVAGVLVIVTMLPSNVCVDCLISCCCQCCALLQITNHLSAYEMGQCSGPKALPEFRVQSA